MIVPIYKIMGAGKKQKKEWQRLATVQAPLLTG
jgi:hypothetical protein